MKKLLLLSALLIFACSSDDEGNPCIYEPTLSTEAVTDITETSATLNGIIAIVSENCDVALGEMQGFVYSTNPSPTNDDNVEVVYGTDINATIDNLIPNTTYYVRVFITNSLGEFYGNEIDFTTEDNGGEPADCDVVYLDENGVTIKACDDANIGDVGIVNGVEYTVVDEAMLRDMAANEEDVTRVVTTFVTNTQGIFAQATPFNQNISSWDMSNVTNMTGMFNGANGATTFNQDISNWDVSSVTSMSFMFFDNFSFNQPLGDWDVSNVIYMEYTLYGATSFNQDLSSWSVDGVTNCESFSGDATSWTLPQPNFTNCNPN